MTATLLVARGIHTLDSGPAARAIAIERARVTWVGDRPGDAPRCDREVDLGDAWILPAFVDAHVHGTATGLAVDGLDLAGSQSLEACLDRLRRYAATRTDEVILGSGWDDFRWPEGRPPSAAEISAAAPGRTVLLDRVDGHGCVVDDRTLAALDLGRLAGVERDAGGHATGWLREQSGQVARRRVRGKVPPQRLAKARRAACEAAATLGIASFHEMGHPGLYGLDDALAWAEGEWPTDVVVWWAELDGEAGPRHGLRSGGDLFLDGSIGSRTAAVSCGYDGGGHGELFHDDDAVTAFFVGASRAGRGAGVHAIGDRAIEQALVGIEAAAAVVGTEAVRRCRHRIEHVELPTLDQVARIARLGVVASVQPAFDATWGGDGGLYAARFGRDVARASNPLGWLADAGVRLAFGSDSTVTPLDPWGAVAAAERHLGGLGIDRRTAITAHTLGGRFVAGQDDVGALRPGNRADLAIWDADPFAVPDPRTLRCLATVVAGRVSFGDEALDGGRGKNLADC